MNFIILKLISSINSGKIDGDLLIPLDSVVSFRAYDETKNHSIVTLCRGGDNIQYDVFESISDIEKKIRFFLSGDI